MKPHASREIEKRTSTKKAAWQGLTRTWQSGLILRSVKSIVEKEEVSMGRHLGKRKHKRSFYLYLLPPQGDSGGEHIVDGVNYVSFSKERLDPRGNREKSKAKRILRFLSEHGGEAFFSREVADALRGESVKPYDVMPAIRTAEMKGLVYVRGYPTEVGAKPFAKGYVLTWLDQSIPRKEAFDLAISATERALELKGGDMPLMVRVQRVRDLVQESLHQGLILPAPYIQNSLRCTDDELDDTIKRALQLYKEDIKEIYVFNQRYLHHSEMPPAVLDAAVKMKQNFIRLSQGAKARSGHNWESIVEAYITLVSPCIKLWEQEHRLKMDPRRITTHLVRPVGKRRFNAELDRVWEQPQPFGKSSIYALECKIGIVTKETLDDFFEVLRWSQDFGADDDQGGRRIKAGVTPIFAASAFNPKEVVRMRDGRTISLAAYAERLGITIIKASSINKLLHERGVPRHITVQKICRIARDEREARALFDAIYKDPRSSEKMLSEATARNGDIYTREEELEGGEKGKGEDELGDVKSSYSSSTEESSLHPIPPSPPLAVEGASPQGQA